MNCLLPTSIRRRRRYPSDGTPQCEVAHSSSISEQGGSFEQNSAGLCGIQDLRVGAAGLGPSDDVTPAGVQKRL